MKNTSLALVWPMALLGLLAAVMIGCSPGLPAASAAAQPTAQSPAAAGLTEPSATVVPVPVTPLPDEVAAASALEAQMIAVYDAVGPAVVNITAQSYAYDRFMRAVQQEGTGSGFVYDTQGHIVTNYHVVEDATGLLVTMASGANYEAQVVGVDAVNDLAVLHIDASADLPVPLVLGDSDVLRVGQVELSIIRNGQDLTLQVTLGSQVD